MPIGDQLKNARKSAGLTVKDVVSRLADNGVKISEKTLYGWENNNRQPDADEFIILCHIYGIKSLLEDFSDDTKESPFPAKPENEDLSKEEILKLLHDVVVKLGWCQPDAPLTNKQVDLLKAIVILIEAGYPPQP